MENEHWKTIGDALKEARRSLELSQRQTGVTLGMLPSLYVAVEEGAANPIDVLKKFFELIGEYEGASRQERDEAREKLARIESLLLDPHAVFLNFLHGKIAKLDWAKLEHIHGPHPARVDCDEARELVYAWESRWKAEVEFAAKVSVKRDELLDILRKLLEIIPEPECHDFGHTKEERHAFLEKCPVMERYHALIAQAEEAAK